MRSSPETPSFRSQVSRSAAINRAARSRSMAPHWSSSTTQHRSVCDIHGWRPLILCASSPAASSAPRMCGDGSQPLEWNR